MTGAGWRLPFGANLASGGVEFRVWAPRPASMAVRLPGGDQPLPACDHGVYEAVLDATPGDDYFYLLDGRRQPDPCSLFQPKGLRGPSRVFDTAALRWSDDSWRGLEPDELVIYELHVGAFTREGTLAAATARLKELADLGVTCVELMPVAEFPGRFGWGYDGVCLYAPTRLYGEPDDLRRFVNEAHAHGVAVILDVVYNHLGPDGNYLRAFSDRYFTDRHQTPWGDGINFDGERGRPVRDFFIHNALYWLE